MVRYRIGRQNTLKVLIVFFALSGHGYLQAETKTFRYAVTGLSVLAALTFIVSWNVSGEEDDFIPFVTGRRAAMGYPVQSIFQGVENYRPDRWIITSKLIGETEGPRFVKLSDVEYWWSLFHFNTDPRAMNLFNHLEKDYQRWKNLTQAKSGDLPSDFLHYSSLVASNCEAIHINVNTADNNLKAFHGGDYLNSRMLCQNWLGDFIKWHAYFPSRYNKSIPVVLVPDWREGKGIISDGSTLSKVIGGGSVTYLFNANYDFRKLRSLYGNSDQELIVVTDRPGYQLKRVRRWPSWFYSIFLPEPFWLEHTRCDPVAGGCRFKNFSGSAEKVTPYLLSHPDTGKQILIFHHGETLVAWNLGSLWSSENKVVSIRAKNNRFKLNLTEAFDLDTTN
ncbi:hypothetical protein [Endozoicomonas sp. 8E]|uniref:hypothetical protein n=1 Tax=Endozoicomonas sp. 8E TaxID=3035692 RepID=UPI002939189F|nr:hypothetical protein [Endozoicomonas sp. 8E]WOG28688.1 hypothetical protein P6910_03240 [Endozoicomonas sp. 8E]